jgi:hypothetical protein
MTEDKECRADFEAWFKDRHEEFNFHGTSAPTGWYYFDDEVDDEWVPWQAAWSRAAKPAVPEGFVLMPKALTADNGAKAALIGEFHEVIEVTCPECDGACEDCDHCQESGTVAQQVTVGWDTIKAIYCKAVELLAAPPLPVAQGWISVQDRLPEDGQTVAFVVDCKNPNWDHLHGRVLGGLYLGTKNGGFSVPGLTVNASHWTPLPAAPTPPAAPKEPTT